MQERAEQKKGHPSPIAHPGEGGGGVPPNNDVPLDMGLYFHDWTDYNFSGIFTRKRYYNRVIHFWNFEIICPKVTKMASI